MPTTEQLESAVRNIAEAAEFIRTRGPQLVTREELERLAADLRATLGRVTPESSRPAIFAGQEPLEQGRYRGLSHFDLSLVKALREAALHGKGRALFHLTADEQGLALGSSRQ